MRNEGPVDHQRRHAECHPIETGNKLARGMKSDVKDWISNKLFTMIVESIDPIQQTQLHNAKEHIRSAVCIVFEQVMFYLFCEQGIREMLNGHIASFSNKNAASNGFSKRPVPLSSFIANITNSERSETSHFWDKECKTAIMSKHKVDKAKTY